MNEIINKWIATFPELKTRPALCEALYYDQNLRRVLFKFFTNVLTISGKLKNTQIGSEILEGYYWVYSRFKEDIKMNFEVEKEFNGCIKNFIENCLNRINSKRDNKPSKKSRKYFVKREWRNDL